MKRTYIATTQEAKALHDGTQTAIIVKHSNKQPYAIGQEVVVREAWNFLHEYDTYPDTGVMGIEDFVYPDGIRIDTWRSPATMPVSAARTRIIPVSCEVVRVRDVTEEQAKQLAVELYKNRDGSYGGWEAPMTYKESAELYLIHKLGQSAWDENHYVFYYKIEKI